MIRSIEPADIPVLARLHRAAFPGFFLSELGEAFLVQFYRGYLADPTAVTVLACALDGKIEGVAVGTTAPAGYFTRLVRRQLLGFAAASLRAVVRHPRTAPRLLRAVRYRGDVPADIDGAQLSSICVSAQRQGAGVGAVLLGAWSAEAAARGARTAFLTTDGDGNDAVNAFYARQGWQLAGSYTTREGRNLNRYTLILDHPGSAVSASSPDGGSRRC